MSVSIEHIISIVASASSRYDTEVYVVGGYVRDILLRRQRTDIDFTIVGSAIQFAERLAQELNTKAVVYERFRTAMVPYQGLQLEFVGTRKEVYNPDSRKPIVTEGSLLDDLKRRDFTVNALAIHINDIANNRLNIIDEFDGIADMERKILRTPLDPHTTFSDDPLRMLRAARFSSQLQFKIEESSLLAMKQMAERIRIISQERISTELLKILASPKPSIGLDILHQSGLLEYVFPEVERLAGVDLAVVGAKKYTHKDVFYHTLKVVDNVAQLSDNVWLRFATLMHDIAKPKTKKFIEGIGWTFHGHEDVGAKWQAKIFRRMKLPLEELPYVETLVRLHQRPMVLVDDGVTDSAVRRLAVLAGDWLDDLFKLCRADITTQNEQRAKKYLKNYEIVYNKIIDVRERDKLAQFQSPVRGEEIMTLCGLQPSRAVGYIKNALEEAILDGLIPNEYEATKQYLLNNQTRLLLEASNEVRTPKEQFG
jgi:poly(A) polymerase